VLETIVVVGWVSLTGIVGLNGFAAGIVAVLHAWRSPMRPGNRTFLASAASGSLPASYMIVVPAASGEAASEFGIMLLVSAVLLAVGTVVSLPGAIIVSRKLASPGDDYRAFE